MLDKFQAYTLMLFTLCEELVRFAWTHSVALYIPLSSFLHSHHNN